MIRKLQGNVTPEDYAKCEQIKNPTGYSWDVFLVKACEAYAELHFNKEE